MKTQFWLQWPGIAILFLLIIVLWMCLPLLTPSLMGENDDKSLYVNRFDGVSALFSGLAFAGLIITLILQARELEEMRKAQKEQADYLTKQSFEHTFFQMMHIWNEHKEAVFCGSATSPPKEIGVISQISQSLTQKHQSLKEHQNHYINRFKADYENTIGPYFTLLLHILLHIKYSGLGAKDEKKYGQFLRACLAQNERQLLLCHCSTYLGRHMKDLVEEFGLLKSIDKDYLNDVVYFKEKFSQKAFK